MTFLTLILAFTLEQLHPLRSDNLLHRLIKSAADWLEQHMNLGLMQHGRLAWWSLILGVTVPVYLMYLLLHWIAPPLAWLWNVVVLFFTLGFRQFSHHYSAIQFALVAGDLATARQELAQWQQQIQTSDSAVHLASPTSVEELPTSEIVRHTLCAALLASHRHVFGVLLCFILLPGPLGAVLYRLADFLARRWNSHAQLSTLEVPSNSVQASQFGRFAAHAFELIDWLPARLTAFTFAIVGNFEDALYCWKTQALRYANTLFPQATRPPYTNATASGILLAAGAGAIGLELANDTVTPNPTFEADDTMIGAQLGSAQPYSEPVWRGATPTIHSLQSGVALVWRAVVMWLTLIGLISAAHWLH